MADLRQSGWELHARQRAILSAAIELYVQTGEPVASQAIASLSGLSSATVRNTMAELADAGMLEQPHTSAGRIPTARAFRLHVEQIRGENRVGPKLLAESSRTQIDAQLYGIAGAEAFLERTSQVLATLSSGVGVALASVQVGDLLEHVHFQRLAQRKVLAVVVTRSGAVRDRVLLLREDLPSGNLEGAARYLNENFRGWSIERVHAEIASRAERERSEYLHLLRSAEELWNGAVPADRSREQTLFVEGVSNLLSGADGDRTRLREMLAALEAKEQLVTLLTAYVGSGPDAYGASVRVVFNMEERAPEMQGLVLIAAPALVDGTRRGTVGVIGTQRMHYENTMNAVGYVAQLFALSLGDGTESN
ncbi:MAG: heat-inducible transcriptional repressor HrcA [Janthinobacterium lividum]